MAIPPVVRHMMVCEGWLPDPVNPHRVTIIGLCETIHSLEEPAYPILLEELCVFLTLTDCRGTGPGQIICVFEETGRRIFGSHVHDLEFGANPLAIRMIGFRMRDCRFPNSGRYSMQFWYDGVMVAEHPLLLD